MTLSTIRLMPQNKQSEEDLVSVDFMRLTHSIVASALSHSEDPEVGRWVRRMDHVASPEANTAASEPCTFWTWADLDPSRKGFLLVCAKASRHSLVGMPGMSLGTTLLLQRLQGREVCGARRRPGGSASARPELDESRPPRNTFCTSDSRTRGG